MFAGYSRAFYSGFVDQSLASAREVVPLVLGLTGARSVVDIGCGQGAWLSVFCECGVEDFAGMDGPHVAPDSLLIPAERFTAADVARPSPLSRTFDLAVSLEVAEHLEASDADAFVGFLAGLAPVVLFSAAIPLQDGTHHVNEQWPTYWAAKFRARGFVVIDAIRPRVWNNEKVAPWYRQNALIFVREEALDAYPELAARRRPDREGVLDLVHPELYGRSHERPMGRLAALALWLPRLAALRLLRLVGRVFHVRGLR